jgi:glycosyltransferase involved in cell wall biosynthesis
VVAVSQGVADDVARATRVRRDDITVIGNPVLTDDLFSSARAPLRHPWFDSGEPPVILGVGSLTRRKDFDSLISAFAHLRRSRPARLMILGEGDHRDRLERHVSRLGLNGDVLMPGFVRNPYPYISKAALLTMSSLCEGLPTVLIESLALGTPTVSTDCRSGPSEILADGRYGMLVPPGDTAALAAALGQTLDGNAPAERPETLSSYSPAEVTDRYESVLSPNGASA